MTKQFDLVKGSISVEDMKALEDQKPTIRKWKGEMSAEEFEKWWDEEYTKDFLNRKNENTN